MLNRKSPRKKAIIAIAFASGSNFLLPAIAESIKPNSQSLIQTISAASVTADWKAYELLQLASMCLNDDAPDRIMARFSGAPIPRTARLFGRRFDDKFVKWAQALSLDAEKGRGEKATTSANKAVAIASIEKAMKLAGQCDYIHYKLQLQYICSLMALKAGDVVLYQKCSSAVAKEIDLCEISAPVEGEYPVAAAASVLNAMAYGILPEKISDQKRIGWLGVYPTTAIKFTATQYEESEKLRLRAITMSDQLEKSSNIRRRLHRDMSLWYSQLGDLGKAEAQKKILFTLVGIDDDRILWPVQRACGAPAWWVVDDRALNSAVVTGVSGRFDYVANEFCGMG